VGRPRRGARAGGEAWARRARQGRQDAFPHHAGGPARSSAMKAAVWILIAVLIGYASVTGMQQFKSNNDFAGWVDHELNYVNENSMDSVKQDLISGAKKMGIDITPNDIDIKYEDTEQRTVAQNLVGKKLAMQYVNKKVTISVDY